MSPRTVRLEREGAVATVVIDRPEVMNAYDLDAMAALVAAFDALALDDAVRAIVLTGAGERAFCTGSDLAFLARGGRFEGSVPARFASYLRHGPPKPTVAAVNGVAAGGGFELAISCDLIVAAEHASFSLPEVRVGYFAAGGGFTLPARLALPLAMELALTGAAISAERAAAIGLVNAVVPLAQLEGAAAALATTIAANAPLAVAATRQLLRTTSERGVDAAWEQSAEFHPVVFGSEDAREGTAAFTERRRPHWRGT